MKGRTGRITGRITEHIAGRIILAVILTTAAAGVVAYRLLAPASVETVAPRQDSVRTRAHGPGTVQARIAVTVGSRSTAVVTAVHADQGDRVRRGQPLASLDDRDLSARAAAARAAVDTVRHNIAAARAALEKAQADLALARSSHARDRDLHRSGFLSAAAVETREASLQSAESGVKSAEATLAARRAEQSGVEQEARSAAATLSHNRIDAPIDGIVIERSAEAGDTVVPGSPLFRMVDPSTLWVAARIDTTLIARIRPGQPAAIRLRSGATLPGKVARITHQADAATRELEVNVAFDAPPARFTLNEEADVSIVLGESAGLVLPAAALARQEGREGVWLVRDGRAAFQPIRTGAAGDGHVIVLEGVSPQDRIIARPQAVKPGQRVRAAD